MTYTTLTFGTPKFKRKIRYRPIPLLGSGNCCGFNLAPANPQSVEIADFETVNADYQDWAEFSDLSIETTNPPTSHTSYIRSAVSTGETEMFVQLVPRLNQPCGLFFLGSWVLPVEEGDEVTWMASFRGVSINEPAESEFLVEVAGDDGSGGLTYTDTDPNQATNQLVNDTWLVSSVTTTVPAGTESLIMFAQAYTGINEDTSSAVDIGAFSLIVTCPE